MPIVNYNKKQKPDYVQPVAPVNSFDGETWFDTTNKLLKVYCSDGQYQLYDFINSNEGFSATNCSITNNSNSITITTTATNPRIYKNVSFYGGQYSIIKVRIKSPGTNSWQGTLYYSTSSHGYTESYKKTITPDPTGEGYVTLTFDMSNLTAGGNDWITNEITSLRFDFGTSTVGEKFEIDWISIEADSTWRQFNYLGAAGQRYGYVCGGYDGSNRLSIIDRIQFPFNSGTATHVGNLSGSKSSLSSCNSSNYGYIAGGNDGSNFLSTIERIQFPFNSGTASNVGNLSESKSQLAACNSSNYGYICGGNSSGSNDKTTIERIQFPFDSGTATHIGNLNNKNRLVDGVINNSNYGYICGVGNYSYRASTIERIQFPFNSGTANHVGNLSGNRDHTSACNSSNYGYIAGGYNGSHTSTIDRILFPFNSGTASHVSNLSGIRSYLSSCNSSNYGYIAGGYNGSNRLSTIDRLNFSFDSSTSTHVGNLSGSRYFLSALDGVDFVSQFI